MHSVDNIIIDLTFILMQLCLFLCNYYLLNKKLFHPAVLFSFLWFSIITLHFILRFTILYDLDALSVDAYLIFFFGTFFFSLGSLMITFSQGSKTTEKSIAPIEEYNISVLLRFILLLIIIIGLPLYIRASFKLFVASQIDNFFKGLRTEISYGDEDIGVVKYLISFSFVVFAINLYSFFLQRNRTNRVILIASFLVTLAYAVFATGRTYFFLILAIFSGISYILNSRFSVKKYFLLIGVFMLFFIGIGVLYDKMGDTEGKLKENISSASESTATYLVTSLNALDYQNLHQIKPNYNGDNTFRFFIKTGQQLNLMPERKVESLLKEFIFVPYATNVYTFYSPYIKDFGKLFAFAMIALFGALHTWIYFKAIRLKTLRYTIYYAFLLYPLLMTFFQDQYMSLFSTWLQVVFYIELFLLTNKFALAKR